MELGEATSDGAEIENACEDLPSAADAAVMNALKLACPNQWDARRLHRFFPLRKTPCRAVETLRWGEWWVLGGVGRKVFIFGDLAAVVELMMEAEFAREFVGISSPPCISGRMGETPMPRLRNAREILKDGAYRTSVESIMNWAARAGSKDAMCDERAAGNWVRDVPRAALRTV
jgi:hypothetical protein